MLRLLARKGKAHEDQFTLRGEPEDIHKAIEYRAIIVALTPDDDPLMRNRLDNLGSAHGKRFLRLGDLVDVELAIEYNVLALSLTPEGDTYLLRRLTNLGIWQGERFQRLGELADLEKAIQYEARAVNLTPKGHPQLPRRLANLGTSHSYRFQRLGELADIVKAIEYQSRAVDLTPNGHADLSGMLATLGVLHKDLFQQLGDLGDLEKAIKYESRAVELTPDGHPDLSSILANLGAFHIKRFRRLDDLRDLENAIEYQSRAVNLTPDGHPHMSSMLANLGAFHSSRFERLGNLSDLDTAIQYQSHALDLTPQGHLDLSSNHSLLGVSHSHRFQRLSELADLEKAMYYHSRALDLTPDGHPDLPMRLANLGTSHNELFLRLDKPDDLEKAIEYQSRAVYLTPDSHPDLSIRLANLGASHTVKFQRLNELKDLEEAIRYQNRALDLSSDNHPNVSSWLVNLGTMLGFRFLRLHQLGDLEHAIQCQSRAVALAPSSHPNLAILHLRLAISHFGYYAHAKQLSHLEHSLNSFRMAARSPTSAPWIRFQSASQWAGFASKHVGLNPLEAFQTAIELLPQFIWLGATTAQRYQDLLKVETLAVDAAHAAIRLSNYALALEWLEHARCIIWNQNLMLRSPLDRLQSSHPILANRLLTASTQLHSAVSNSRESLALASGSMTAEQVAQQHHQLANEYNNLLSQARMLPSFEDFLQPIKANRLVCSARYGSVVVINCHEDQCDALLVLPGQDTVKYLTLPNITGTKARILRSGMAVSLGSNRREARDIERRPWIETDSANDFGSILAVIWTDIVKPVLDFLGYTHNPPMSTSTMPHITWCPTGAMSFLPLHAAGDYTQPRSRVFDYVISSYTPTLTALLESTPSTLGINSGLLAIGQQATPGHSRLPGTATELALVKAHTEPISRYSQLIDHQATTTAVLDAMEQHHWVHLACHAHQNVDNATESGFFLHDGTLDLAAINRRSFRNKGLAFLSACQTATGDQELPDEAIHLASGMLMAGYTSVIATMWSVGDSDAPVVADEVYARLMKDGKLGNGEAGRALQEAVAVLRERVGEESFEQWVPFIHIGS
ncbi:unnamed protein product [Rhizoctonia solani]|uniref:CHAT domain-containing protein n=1 Tax=Rhizoctonia solani TaxID=456999 RepID=A0A8H3GZ23_9AGAM|nr:unnamed protein product [Rhizoctonia solani]